MGFKSERRLTAHEFDRLLPYLTGLSEQRLGVARKVMVEGLPQQSLADEHGWTRNNVSMIVRRVWDEHERFTARQEANAPAPAHASTDDVLPPGYERTTFVAPTELLTKWRSELASYVAHPVKAAPRKK